MPLLHSAVPRYRQHRASGQAIVTISGVDHYLGPHGTKTSKREYDRLIAEWLAAGRPALVIQPAAVLKMKALIATYLTYAQKYYRKNGKTTGEFDNIRYAMRPIRKLYADLAVTQFGPKALKTIQQYWVEENLCRTMVNSRVARIKRMFRWAVAEELLPVTIFQALATVPGLKRGRSAARESQPVKPVADEKVVAILPFLPTMVQAMVVLQQLTGARPSEICELRPEEINRDEPVWQYRPASHKTEHHGREKIIYFGPQSQLVLQPYLQGNSGDYCFNPQLSETERKKKMRAKRQSKVQPSQLNRAKSNPRRKPGTCYNSKAYCRAIYRACDQAFPPPAELVEAEKKLWRKAHRWSPGQIRHSTGTKVRERYGIEGAQLILGHAKVETTQIYAERDLSRAMQIAAEIS